MECSAFSPGTRGTSHRKSKQHQKEEEKAKEEGRVSKEAKCLRLLLVVLVVAVLAVVCVLRFERVSFVTRSEGDLSLATRWIGRFYSRGLICGSLSLLRFGFWLLFGLCSTIQQFVVEVAPTKCYSRSKSDFVSLRSFFPRFLGDSGSISIDCKWCSASLRFPSPVSQATERCFFEVLVLPPTSPEERKCSLAGYQSTRKTHSHHSHHASFTQ